MGRYKVYIITNDVNEKVYVGSTTKSLGYRFNQHCRSLGSPIDRAIAKIGKEHFKIGLLDDNAADLETLDFLENMYVEQYKAIESGYNVRRPNSRSQRRASNKNEIDMCGCRFGKLTVLEKAESVNGRTKWRCVCDCGNVCIRDGRSLRSGSANSCGCNRLGKPAHNKKPYIVHSRLYYVWQGMKSRCYNKKNKGYSRYGGRGITVCAEWRNDYQAFYDWAIRTGYDENAPRNQCTLDRIDVNGDYDPSNCRWANSTEQNLNQQDTKLIDFNGKSMTVCQWADYLSWDRTLLINRFSRGWTAEEALSIPPSPSNSGIHHRKKVICIETVKIFPSIDSAATAVGKKPANISISLREQHRTCGGYHWRYVPDDIDFNPSSFCAGELKTLDDRESEKKRHSAELKEIRDQKYRELRASSKKPPKPRNIDYMKKPVVCVETGVVFSSVKEAADFYGIHTTNISGACKLKKEFCHGFHWKFLSMPDEEYNALLSAYRNKTRKRGGKTPRPVVQLETGIVFPSLSDAAKSLNLGSSGLASCLSGKNKTFGGYHWSYYEDGRAS